MVCGIHKYYGCGWGREGIAAAGVLLQIQLGRNLKIGSRGTENIMQYFILSEFCNQEQFLSHLHLRGFAEFESFYCLTETLQLMLFLCRMILLLCFYLQTELYSHENLHDTCDPMIHCLVFLLACKSQNSNRMPWIQKKHLKKRQKLPRATCTLVSLIVVESLETVHRD